MSYDTGYGRKENTGYNSGLDTRPVRDEYSNNKAKINENMGKLLYVFVVVLVIK
jgi:hypothetical protein